jgi:pentatricopeptide repeat protein
MPDTTMPDNLVSLGEESSPDIVAYNSMLNSFFKAGMPENAYMLLEQMVRQYIYQSNPSLQTASFNAFLPAQPRLEIILQWMEKLTPNCGIAGPNCASVEHVFSQF